MEIENSFLGMSLDPRVVQGLLTTLAAIIGSMTALFIALFVYPRQKQVDRENEMRRERRDAYRAFLSEVLANGRALTKVKFHDVLAADSFFSEGASLRAKYSGALSLLSLVASKEVLRYAIKLDEVLAELFEEVSDELKKLINVAEARTLGIHEVEKQVNNLLKKHTISFIAGESLIASVMRAEEFGADDIGYLIARGSRKAWLMGKT